MKLAPALLALSLLLPSAPALAHDTGCVRVSRFGCADPLRWADRHDDGDARFAITTVDGKVTLLLTDGVVAMQLSNRTMRRLDREMHRARHEDDDDDGPLADAIRTAVIGTVQSVLDHRAECPLREIRDVRYERGRLVIVSRGGRRLFERIEVNDDDVLESFDPRDAADFAREFRRLQAARY